MFPSTPRTPPPAVFSSPARRRVPGSFPLAATRSDRPVEVQALFREVNERVREVSATTSATTDFICECDDESCFVPVELTPSEYDAVRASPIRFLVAAGHLGAQDDPVVRGARYWVVEKASAPSAEAALRRDGRFASG